MAADTSVRPTLRQNLGLFQDRLRRLLLLVGRVAVLAQDAANEATEVFAQRPLRGWPSQSINSPSPSMPFCMRLVTSQKGTSVVHRTPPSIKPRSALCGSVQSLGRPTAGTDDVMSPAFRYN